MKKGFLLIILVLILTCCVACSNRENLYTIEEGKLIMGTNAYFPPYEYFEGDIVKGIDAEIAEELAERLGLELVIKDMEFPSIIPAVEDGNIDIGMAAMTITLERQELVNFTNSYAIGEQVVVVRRDSLIESVDEISELKIGVQKDTTGCAYALNDFPNENVFEYNKSADAILALTQEKIDAVIIDGEPARKYVEANLELKMLSTNYSTEDYAICVSKDNELLLSKINTILMEMKEDGTINAIVAKYIE